MSQPPVPGHHREELCSPTSAPRTTAPVLHSFTSCATLAPDPHPRLRRLLHIPYGIMNTGIHDDALAPRHTIPPHEILGFHGTPGSRGPTSAVLSYALSECAPSGPRRRTTIWRTWPENHDVADGLALGSSCWLEHDLMAKKHLQLMDEAADLAMVVHPGDVEVGTKIAKTGVRIRKQVPDDDQDGAGYRNQCLELARPLDETSVAFSQEGVGPGRRCCRLAQGEDHVVENGTRPLREVASEVLRVAGWLA